jgi:hypothetical protein
VIAVKCAQWGRLLTFSVGRVCGRSRHALSESHRRAERSRLLANKHRAGVRAVAVAVVDADPDGIGRSRSTGPASSLVTVSRVFEAVHASAPPVT